MSVGLTLDSAKGYLGITDSTWDLQLETLLPVAELRVERYCNHEFTEDDFTEYYSGDGTNKIVLRRWPVVSVTNVWQDPAGAYGDGVDAFSGDPLVQGVDYALKIERNGESQSGIIERLNGIWSSYGVRRQLGLVSPVVAPLTGNIKVTYTTTSAPVDVQYATALYLAWLLSLSDGGINGAFTLKSERTGDYQWETDGSGYDLAGPGRGKMPSHIAAILNSWRDRPVA